MQFGIGTSPGKTRIVLGDKEPILVCVWRFHLIAPPCPYLDHILWLAADVVSSTER
jgi:hypothetical protein